MSEGFRSTSSEPQWVRSNAKSGADGENEAGRALIVGVLGGLLSAAGYLIYRRLPDEQKERLHEQVRSQIQSRIAEIRSNFNI